MIEDDSIGMDLALRVTGLGLIGMRERVAGLNSHFSIVSQTGKGTTISVELPLMSVESGTSYRLLAVSKSVNDIAALLKPCSKSVGQHMAHLKNKPGIANIAGLTRLAVRPEILTP